MGIKSNSNIQIKRRRVKVTDAAPATVAFSYRRLDSRVPEIIGVENYKEVDAPDWLKEIHGTLAGRVRRLTDYFEGQVLSGQKKEKLYRACQELLRISPQSKDQFSYPTTEYFMTMGSGGFEYKLSIQEFHRPKGFDIPNEKIHYPGGRGITIAINRGDMPKASVDIYENGTIRVSSYYYRGFLLLQHGINKLLEQLP